MLPFRPTRRGPFLGPSSALGAGTFNADMAMVFAKAESSHYRMASLGRLVLSDNIPVIIGDISAFSSI